MDDLCTACLCTGRKLYFIGETGCYHLYSQILNEIPVYDFSDVCVRVCWECRASLRRFGDFKTLVKRSYTELLQQLHQNIPPLRNSLIREPRLQARHLDVLSFPEVFIKKEEDHDSEQLLNAEALELLHEDIEDLDRLKEEPEFEEKRSKKIAKKTTKEKLKKKKRKAQTKKVKKKITTPKDSSVTSEDSKLQICDGFSDRYDSDDETLKSIVDERQKKEEGERSKENSVEELPKEKEFKKPPKKNNGAVPREKLPEFIGDKPKCPECGKMFSSKKTYRYHMNTLHKGQNRYPCPRCGKVYQWKSNLGRHMRSHKARDSGELYCETCDKRFASVATYRQHLRVSRRHVSESEYSFTCNDCGKKFVNKTRLRDHVDWDHLKKIKFKCQLCNKPFKCHTSLYVHLHNVHRDNKKENLCHICGKSYQNAAKLKYHIVAMHTSETPYQCAHCEAAFGWYSSLYRHVREVHYKMKLQPKKMRKSKRNEILPSLLPGHEIVMPPVQGHT